MNLKSIFQKYQNLFFYISIFILILIGFFLRLKPALIRPITYDEAFTLLYLIDKPDINSMILADASVPPLQYLLVKFVASFSTNIIYPRIFSLFFSILSLFVITIWLKKTSKLLAILVIFFLSFSAFQIFYAWEAYVYPQLFLLGIVSLYSLYQALYGKNLTDKKLKVYLIVYMLSSLAAFFTHYSFVWTIFAELTIIFGEYFYAKLFNKKFNFLIIKFSLILIIALICYLPIFFSLFPASMGNLSWMQKPTVFSFGYVARTLFGLINFDLNGNLINTGTILASLFTFLFISLCAYLVFNKKSKFFNKNEKKLVLYNVIVFVFNLFIPLFCSFFLRSSIYGERTLIVASVSITILVSIFLMKMLRANALTFSLVFLFCYFIFSQNINLNQTQLKILHRSDISKYYVDLFRKDLTLADQNFEKNIVFIDFTNKDYSAVNYIDKVRRNLVFDYYWFGYDGQKPLPKYKLIDANNFSVFKNDPFFGIVMIGDKDMDKNMGEVCSNLTKKYVFFGWEPLYLFRCN